LVKIFVNEQSDWLKGKEGSSHFPILFRKSSSQFAREISKVDGKSSIGSNYAQTNFELESK